MQQEPAELQTAVVDKWEKIYKGETPFPSRDKAENENGAEVVYDPKEHEAKETQTVIEQQKTASRDNPPEYIKWLRENFNSEYKDALDYRKFSDAPETLSDQALELLIKDVERLVDFGNQE